MGMLSPVVWCSFSFRGWKNKSCLSAYLCQSKLLSLSMSSNQKTMSPQRPTFLEKEFHVWYKLWKHYVTFQMAAICWSLSGLIKPLLCCLGTIFWQEKIKKSAFKDLRFLRGNQELLKPLPVSASSKGREALRTTCRFAYFDQTDWLLLKPPTLLTNPEPCTWTQQGLVITTANVLPPPKAKDKKSLSFFSCMNYLWGALQLLDTQIRQEHRVFTPGELT